MDKKELKRLCDNTTPGPWNHEVSQGGQGFEDGWEVYSFNNKHWQTIVHTVCNRDDCKCFDDAAFITAAKEAVPELLEENQRLLSLLEKLTNKDVFMLDDCGNCHWCRANFYCYESADLDIPVEECNDVWHNPDCPLIAARKVLEQ